MITLSLHLGFSTTTRWWLWKAWPLVSISKKQSPPSMCVFSFCVFSSCFLTQRLLLLLSKTGKNKIVITEQSTLAIKTFKTFNLLGRTKHYLTFRHFPLCNCAAPWAGGACISLLCLCNVTFLPGLPGATTWLISSPPDWGGAGRGGGRFKLKQENYEVSGSVFM